MYKIRILLVVDKLNRSNECSHRWQRSLEGMRHEAMIVLNSLVKCEIRDCVRTQHKQLSPQRAKLVQVHRPARLCGQFP